MKSLPHGLKMRFLAGLTILVVLGSATYLALRKHTPTLFTKSCVFLFYMRAARGVEVGTPVWVKGLDAGEVISMDLEDVPATMVGSDPGEGRILAVKVKCRIFSPFHRLLREGSNVEILLLSVFGRPRVYVHPGPPGMPRAPDEIVLANRITRGLEGQTEDFIDRAQRIDKRMEGLSVYLDAVEEDSEDIERRYLKRNNTLYALTGEGPDRRNLEDASRELELTMNAVSGTNEAIRANLDALGEDPLRPIQRDFEEALDSARTALDEARASREAWRRARERFEELTLVSQDAVTGTKGFLADFRVFYQAKDEYLPGILEDYHVLDRNLLQLAVNRMMVASMDDPRIEEILQAMRRGRLAREERY